MAETLLSYIVWFTLSLLTTIITSVLLPRFSKWLSSKTQNECIQSLIADLTATVETAVNHYEQTMVTSLKQCGKWDLDAQHKILNSVTKEVVTNLMDTTKKTIENNGQDIYDVVIRYIESYIQSQKGEK